MKTINELMHSMYVKNVFTRKNINIQLDFSGFKLGFSCKVYYVHILLDKLGP